MYVNETFLTRDLFEFYFKINKFMPHILLKTTKSVLIPFKKRNY